MTGDPDLTARHASGIDAWRQLLGDALGERDLPKHNTRDGITLHPLYARRSDGVSLPGRGPRPWTILQILDDVDPDAANAQALSDLEGGATGLSLRLGGAPSAAGGGLPPEHDALGIALEGIDLAEVSVRLEPHPAGQRIAGWLSGIALESGIAPELTDIMFGLDPVAGLANREADGELHSNAYATCIEGLLAAGFRGPFAELDGRVYHDAGATEAQELAGILAAAAWWLRTLDEAGHAPRESLPLLGASLAVDRDPFYSLAKLRALRLLWARLQELCEAPRQPLRIHAETGRPMLTRADPHTNLLRTTLAAFAAAAGGADAITVLPHTAALGHPDRDARALARNIQHLLIEEAHVHRVWDPGAGAGAIEAFTDALAETAWAEFQTIEREGGILASLGAGAFQRRIAEARAALRNEAPLVGATIYRAPDAVTPEHPRALDHALAELALAPVRLEELMKADA